MTHSHKNMAPGLLIWHSKDLFASLKLGIYTKGSGALRLKNFEYRDIEREESQ